MNNSNVGDDDDDDDDGDDDDDNDGDDDDDDVDDDDEYDDDGDDGGDDDDDDDGDYNADLPARIAGHLHKLPILPLMKSMMKMTTVLMAARCNSQKK